jgi:hypothetical protein
VIRRVPEVVLAPALRAVRLDSGKKLHSQQLFRTTEELLRQRSFEWEPQKSVLKHLSNGSSLYWKNAFHGWVQRKMNRLAERIPSMSLPTYTSR